MPERVVTWLRERAEQHEAWYGAGSPSATIASLLAEALEALEDTSCACPDSIIRTGGDKRCGKHRGIQARAAELLPKEHRHGR